MRLTAEGQNGLPENERANVIMRAYCIGTDGTYNPWMADEESNPAKMLFSLPLTDELPIRAIRYQSYSLHQNIPRQGCGDRQ
jgi:hypothetical protein